MNINLQEFTLDPTIVAPTIYQWKEREITNLWISCSPETRNELDRFIEQYLRLSWFPASERAFLRIDAYINPDGSWIQILDVNASFVDGWWNALNLTRAIGTSVDRTLLESFPTRLMLPDELYKPEFDLAQMELERLWKTDTPSKKRFLLTKNPDARTSTYVYGNPVWITQRNIYPYDALRMDNKRILSRLSETWQSEIVKIPTIYTPDSLSWEALPDDGILKLISKKDIEENPNIRRVQLWVKKNNQALKLLWDAGRLVVQEKAETMKNGDNNIQAILLTTRKVVAGYTQFSPKGIINDDSLQWPLLLQP